VTLLLACAAQRVQNFCLVVDGRLRQVEYDDTGLYLPVNRSLQCAMNTIRRYIAAPVLLTIFVCLWS
jgi:hypothetical protein